MAKRMFANRLLSKLFWLLLLLLLWELISRSGIFEPTLFPPFSKILLVFWQELTDGLLLEKTCYSLQLILKGLFLSLAITVVLSFGAVSSRWVEDLVDVLNSILHPLPGIALLPVAILWFGIGETSILFIILHSVIWPMVVNLKTGFRSVPSIYLELGRSFGLKGIRLLGGVILPSSLPYFISGLKIGWARAWRAVIAAEMVFGAASGTAGGLGWHIYMTRYYFDIAGTFAALLAIVIIGILVEELFFNILEKMTIKKWGMV
ncbi:NitT/TauT family transport system permease protein [Thermosyntropha lipolytica DSM 11003]|uniref:NitT/TauT family transport system permease protein n=1 Tax=Thermosyntropha lipolytica DSM 11003 TaxID=1123382 RepID=A0A1M5LKA4_9FIRM|nr:ABC transporter permease [Thermosyntropha lipolytica]SHG65467.1 NitT/TauT family transport system permease protein [Thermosyntropha lipolytica DSM 11003]